MLVARPQSLADPRVPYFKLDEGLRMASDDWSALVRELSEERLRVRFILYAPYQQRNERADLLLKELDKLADKPAHRVILLASILWYLEEDARRARERK